jgi:hypothetical protein
MISIVPKTTAKFPRGMAAVLASWIETSFLQYLIVVDLIPIFVSSES